MREDNSLPHPYSLTGNPSPEVRLPRTLVSRMLQLAQQSSEREVCGLIGEGPEGTTLYPVPNVASAPAYRFRLDPRAQIDAMRRMRERGETLLAIYHSHPHASAWPSLMDLQEASYPGTLYLIISLDTRGVLEMRGFRLADAHVTEVTLVL
jgi:proteasome lid subunit RPN8/RPN11